MKNYIANLLVALNHPAPKNPQLSPHRCREIKYVSKVHHAHEEDTSAPLDPSGIQRVQQIVGAHPGLDEQ